MDGGEMHDLVGAYVLDALSPAETRAFQEHLQSCSECQIEVRHLQEAVGALPLAVDLIEPPPDLFDRIRDTIEHERPALQPITGGRPEPRRPVPWSYLEIAVAAAAAVLIVALGVWNIHLQSEISKDQTALQYQHAISQAILNGGHVSTISGTADAPGATAAVVQPAHSGPGYLIVRGLPDLASNRVYEVWLVKPSTSPVPAGVFSSAGTGVQIWQLSKSARGFPLTAVTEEPGPDGSLAPHGPKVLAGSTPT
jgi:anti-sigma-K factor RskA